MCTPPMPSDVANAYDRFPPAVRARLMQIRALIFETAQAQDVGPLTETLKWGEPAYLTEASKAGSTIRLGTPKSDPDTCAVFLNCRTTLVETLRARFPTEFTYQGNRAVLMPPDRPLPATALSFGLGAALTYHRKG